MKAFTPGEEKLFAAIARGETVVLDGSDVVRSEVLRCLVLGLRGEEERSAWTELLNLVASFTNWVRPVRAPVGVSINGGIVSGRLDLSSATGDCQPVCPLEFTATHLDGGLSGAHGRFSRLSFINCSFLHPAGLRSTPTIDLSGAGIEGDLHLRGIHPAGVTRDSRLRRTEGDYLWIRLNGARVDGEVDLCGSYLRAPHPTPRLVSEDAADALDLTLAEIKGDLQFLNGARSDGRIKIRTAHIAGDVWMTGAIIDNPGQQALLIQGTRIDGFLMMDGGFDDVDKTQPFRRFKCIGTVKLEAAEIGRSLHVEDALIRGPIEAPHLSIRDDFILHGEVSGAIDLSGCRIGGSLDLSKLNLASSAQRVSLKDGNIGRSLKVAQPEVPYEFLGARAKALEGLPPLKLVETLWRLVPRGRDQSEDEVPLRRQLVQAAFLVDDTRPRDVRIFHLDGHADVLRRAIERRHSKELGKAGRADIRLICGAYVLRARGFTGLPEDSRWFENGLVILPSSPGKELRAKIAKGEWITDSILGKMDDYPAHKSSKERFAHHVESNPLLQACFDLEGLSCEMLEDRGGRAWGEHYDRIRLNHFVYRRADWGFEKRARRKPDATLRRLRTWASRWWSWLHEVQLAYKAARLARRAPTPKGAPLPPDWLKPLWNSRPSVRGYAEDHVQTRTIKSSYGWLRDRFKGAQADWLWPMRRGRRAARLREQSYYLEPWQVRRNWIYRQYTPLPVGNPASVSRYRQRTPLPVSNLVSVSRYRIGESEYRSQPFEQAALVARAEGRDEFAVRFESLKRRIEWRLFNRRIRWPLAGFAIACGAGWLLLNGAEPVPTLLALLATWFMMGLVSSINDRLRWISWLWPRRVFREFILYLPALLLLAISGWWSHPFDFIVAFLIYLGIRFISVFSHAFMRFGFGYLRRPVRAIVTLVLAFLLGWWSVHLANKRDMLVIDAEPVADLAGPEPQAEFPYRPNDAAGHRRVPVLMGSSKTEANPQFVRELSCAATVSEALYALDVLIPLVDLREESRCEVRRVPHRAGDHSSAHRAEPKETDEMTFPELARAAPELWLGDNRFWWWAKALYAIAGWFIVSLALLTFAQVNRARGEPAEEA